MALKMRYGSLERAFTKCDEAYFGARTFFCNFHTFDQLFLPLFTMPLAVACRGYCLGNILSIRGVPGVSILKTLESQGCCRISVDKLNNQNVQTVHTYKCLC
jgi:hypothetical protein